MTPTNVKKVLLRSYRMLLQPLVRILMRNGVVFDELIDTVRAAMIEVAVRHELDKGEVSVPTVTKATGVAPADVKRILNASLNTSGEPIQEENDMVVRVLEGWHRDDGYVGVYGLANELDRNEFDVLCTRHAPGLSPDRVIELLIDAGCIVEIADEDTNGWRCKCIERTYISKPLTQPQIERMGNVLSHLVNTMARNMDRGKSPRVEKRVFRASGLSSKYLDEFDSQIRAKSDEFLLSLDNWLSTCHSESEEEELVQTGVTVFHYVESEADKRPLQEVMAEKGLGKENLNS